MQIIAHNLISQFTSRQLNLNTKTRAKVSEKLSSGYQINRAADDAAGLSISEKMRSQIRGLHRASNNIQDGISLVQVADGALAETQDLLQRMNELTIQAANDTNQKTDRDAIQEEINALKEEINRIAIDTEFNSEIYPLRKVKVESPDIPGSDNASNVKKVDPTTISAYASYRDSDNRLHYQLGSGTFQIVGLQDCVFDVSGDTYIEETSLTNVTINCAAGTSLSVKNVKIDNSANLFETQDAQALGMTLGIGAAIKFVGSGNTLNCYGDNEFNGGMDNYGRVYYPFSGNYCEVACSGINVGSGTELTINGTDTSNLIAHGCNGDYGSISCGIGSNDLEDGGNIIINSGRIHAYSSIEEEEGYGWIGIGGGGKYIYYS